MERLRIAVAEDEWLLAEQLCAQLESLGHEVVGIARTGPELMATVTRERPDLALVDIRLARGSDGLAAAKRIWEQLRVPAIAATGHLTADEAQAAGLLGLLRKPLTRARLQPVLSSASEWLKTGRHATTPGSPPFFEG